MYEDVGVKIKIVAVIVALLGTIATFIRGMMLISDHQGLVGILTCILGPLLSYACSLFVYGFGKIVEHSEQPVIVEDTQEKQE